VRFLLLSTNLAREWLPIDTEGGEEKRNEGEEREGGEERRCAVGIFNYFRLWVLPVRPSVCPSVPYGLLTQKEKGAQMSFDVENAAMW